MDEKDDLENHIILEDWLHLAKGNMYVSDASLEWMA